VEIRRAVDAGDTTALARVAHGLGGSLRTLMAPRGGELTAALEQLAERGSIDGALPLCDELQAEVARIHDALTALLVPPPVPPATVSARTIRGSQGEL
jgi:HPt (histidine-containing phosphotransfer) domain-containing protein